MTSGALTGRRAGNGAAALVAAHEAPRLASAKEEDAALGKIDAFLMQ